MRAIKFRAWHPIHKRMIWGPTEGGSISPAWVLTMCQANPEVPLMQFTGLRDKNGKEIYEGDILEWDDEGNEGESLQQRGKVLFEAAVFAVEGRYDYNAPLSEICDIDLEVVGNIYETPKLVKGGPK